MKEPIRIDKLDNVVKALRGLSAAVIYASGRATSLEEAAAQARRVEALARKATTSVPSDSGETPDEAAAE